MVENFVWYREGMLITFIFPMLRMSIHIDRPAVMREAVVVAGFNRNSQSVAGVLLYHIMQLITGANTHLALLATSEAFDIRISFSFPVTRVSSKSVLEGSLDPDGFVQWLLSALVRAPV